VRVVSGNSSESETFIPRRKITDDIIQDKGPGKGSIQHPATREVTSLKEGQVYTVCVCVCVCVSVQC
jgi:hypothetical protein